MAQTQFRTKSIQLTAETWDRLEEIAKKEEVSTTAVVRRIILEGINNPTKGEEKMLEFQKLQMENKHLKEIIAIHEKEITRITELRNEWASLAQFLMPRAKDIPENKQN